MSDDSLPETVSGSDPVPFNTYRLKRPASARVLSNERISRSDCDDVRHVVLDLEGLGLKYLEGQSLGVITPGVDDKGHANKLRLYSIASSRRGDDAAGRTASLCVKRVVHRDEAGRVHLGTASNYLCDTRPGDRVAITGPVGKTFLLPNDPASHLILAATGTGVAPFRGFLRHIFHERRDWTGQVWLFFGTKTAGECLYRDEFESYRQYPNFQLEFSFSREQTGHDGYRMYVHHRMHEQIDPLWDLLDRDTSMLYICGKKGMEDHIEQVLAHRAHADGISWSNFRHLLIESGRLLVETY
jgi:ferredoxin--NADP+ reductase